MSMTSLCIASTCAGRRLPLSRLSAIFSASAQAGAWLTWPLSRTVCIVRSIVHSSLIARGPQNGHSHGAAGRSATSARQRLPTSSSGSSLRIAE
jgi:hypothetical protein